MKFNQNALHALMEGSDGEEWGGLRHYAMMEILGGEDTNDDIASASCSSTTSRDHEELPGAQPRTRAFFGREPSHKLNWHRRYLHVANARNHVGPR